MSIMLCVNEDLTNIIKDFQIWKNTPPISITQVDSKCNYTYFLKGNQEEDQKIEVGILMTEAGDGSDEAVRKGILISRS